MSSFEETNIECKKTFEGKNGVVLFQLGESYLARVFTQTAVVRDETGCFRSLYEVKSDKFYREYFKEIKIEDKMED